MSADDFRVVFDRLADWKFALGCLLAADDFPLQLFARVQIDAFRIGHMAARAHYVEIKSFTDFAAGVVVSDPKSVRLRRLQLVENLPILIAAFRAIGLRILGSAKPATDPQQTPYAPPITPTHHQETLSSTY